MPGAFVDGVVDGDDMRDTAEEGVGGGGGLFRHDGVEELGFRGVDPVAGRVGAGFRFGVGGGFGRGERGGESAWDGRCDSFLGEGAGGFDGVGGGSGRGWIGGLGDAVGGAFARGARDGLL